MEKGQTEEVKIFVDGITEKKYTKTFSSKSETLHIRIGTYPDSLKETKKDWIADKENERQSIINQLQKKFPQYEISKSNKRYQGFINDICITVK